MFYKPIISLRQQLTHVKDKTYKFKKCGGVYHIQCEGCDQDYIGETGRTLETSVKEHNVMGRSSSAIHEHCNTSGHSIDPNNTTIITSDDSNLKRRVKEAIEIKQRRSSLNRKEGLDLPPVCGSLLLSHDRTRSCDF